MYILIDIGATNTRVGIADNLSKIGKYNILPSSAAYEVGLHNIKKSAALLGKGKQFKNAAVGIVGSINEKRNSVWASTLKNYANKPIKKDLENIFNCSFNLENDAALAGLGEAVFGAGKKYGSIGYLTFSTGVGGVKIENKKIASNLFGFEPKHMIINSNKGLVKWGELVEGRSITRQFKKRPEKIKDKKFWQDLETWMSIGIHNTACLWSPEAIIIGGAISHNKNISTARINNFLMHTLMQTDVKIPVLKSQLGQLNGLYGALALLKN